METEVDLGARKIKIKDMNYFDFLLQEETADKKERAFRLFELSGIDREIAKSLTAKEGTILVKVINKLNGFEENQQ